MNIFHHWDFGGKRGLWLCQGVELQWVDVFWVYAMSASEAGWVPYITKTMHSNIYFFFLLIDFFFFSF